MTQAGPNLFDFATGELSQDAFLAWIAHWADDKYSHLDSALNLVARQFLNELSDGAFMGAQIKCIKTERQFKKTDVLIAVELSNPDKSNHLIVIEDKTSTGLHSDQLKRYKGDIDKEVVSGEKFKNYIPHYVYYKTHDHITRAEHLFGFRNFTRQKTLEIFESQAAQGVKNNIFIDYVSMLRKIEDESNQYKTMLVSEWKYAQWVGYFKAVCEDLGGDANFGYVSNRQGGFIGAWFGGITLPEINEGDSIYFQMEGEKKNFPHFNLKIRVGSGSKERTKQIKSHVLPILMERLEKSKIEFSKNIGHGKSVAIITVLGLEISDTADKVVSLTHQIRNIIMALHD